MKTGGVFSIKKLVFVLGVCLGPWSLCCQNSMSASAWLGTARYDLALKLKGNEITARQAADIRLPFVNAVSLRSETNRFELIRQEYTMRVSLNGFKEMTSIRRTQQALLLAAGAQQRLLLHEALADRYDALLQYKSLLSEISLLNELQAVQEERLGFLRKKAALQSSTTDIEDLIKTESDRDETLMDMAEKQGDLEVLQQFFDYVTGGITMLDTSAMAGIENISQWQASLPFELAFYPELLDQEAKIGLVDAEYQAEKAKSKKILDYLQTRYSDRPGDPFRYDFFVGVGFNLPYRGSVQTELAELKIERLETTNQLQIEQAENKRLIAELKKQLAANIKQYDLAQKQLQESQALFSFNKGAADPLILLSAAEHLLKRRLKLADLENQIYYAYFSLLDQSGLLSTEPLINYLSPSLEKL